MREQYECRAAPASFWRDFLKCMQHALPGNINMATSQEGAGSLCITEEWIRDRLNLHIDALGIRLKILTVFKVDLLHVKSLRVCRQRG